MLLSQTARLCLLRRVSPSSSVFFKLSAGYKLNHQAVFDFAASFSAPMSYSRVSITCPLLAP
jgi:hypothetical protein